MYTKSEIIDEVNQHVVAIDQLYKNKIMNYRGFTTDLNSKERFTEVISEELLRLEVKNKMSSIFEVEREKSCKIATHDGIVATESNRFEEIYAKKLYGKELRFLGKIIDYQIPLKNKKTNKGLGKIDLISATHDRVYLIELKLTGNKETLLRCVLEIATYYQVLSKSCFLSSYSSELGQLSAKDIKKAILIMKDSLHYKEAQDIQKGNRTFLKKIMNELEVEIFYLDPESLIIEKL